MRRATGNARTNAHRRDIDERSERAAFEEIVREEGRRPARAGKGEEGTKEIGCRIKALPTRLQGKANMVAARVNPANAPVLEAISLPEGIDAPMFLTIATSKYWGPRPREFTVSFMETTSPELRSRILSHMNAWSQRINKTFVQTSGVGEVRISRGPGGFFSFLGTDVELIPEHLQTMNLEGFTMNTRESEYKRVIRHETGHTLGFPHEHMRAELVERIDPEKAIPFFLETQGWDEETVNEQVLTSLDEDTIFGTSPDEDSIMCYQLPGEITFDGLPIRGGVDINETDFDFAAAIYPLPSSSRKSTRKRAAEALADEEDWGPEYDVELPYL